MNSVELKLGEAIDSFPAITHNLAFYDGGMNSFIDAREEAPQRVRVKVFTEGDQPIAWAWMIPLRLHGKRCLGFMVFVDPIYRRKGVGSKLFAWGKQMAQRQHRSLVVFPWDDISETFFDQNKVRKKNMYDWDAFEDEILDRHP